MMTLDATFASAFLTTIRLIDLAVTQGVGQIVPRNDLVGMLYFFFRMSPPHDFLPIRRIAVGLAGFKQFVLVCLIVGLLFGPQAIAHLWPLAVGLIGGEALFAVSLIRSGLALPIEFRIGLAALTSTPLQTLGVLLVIPGFFFPAACLANIDMAIRHKRITIKLLKRK